MELKEHFHKVATRVSAAVGTARAFIIAISIIVLWSVSGPLFHFSDTWQLVINTGTTIVTFLMVFLIQNTQNRDAKAIHLKLDELIRALKGARNELIDLEEMTDAELEELEAEFRTLRDKRTPATARVAAAARLATVVGGVGGVGGIAGDAVSTDTAKAGRRSSSPDRRPSSRRTTGD